MPQQQLQEKIAPPPNIISEILFGQWKIQALKSALELSVFDHLQSTNSAIDIANKTHTDQKGIELLLNALAGMKLLDKSGQKYSLNDLSSNYLLSSSPSYIGPWFEMSTNTLKDIWCKLTQTIRSGKPEIQVNDDAKAQEFFPVLAEAIYPLSSSFASTLAEKLSEKYSKGKVKTLDVACGSSVWSIPLAQMNPELTVDALDFPPILEVTKKFVSKLGVAKQYQYVPGNWRDVKWQENAYDIILLGHILHSEGMEYSKRLIAQCALSLKKGGTLVIADFVCNSERTTPAFAALFAINMYVATKEGCIFSENDLKTLLSEAGFSNPQQLLHKDGTETSAWISVKQ